MANNFPEWDLKIVGHMSPKQEYAKRVLDCIETNYISERVHLTGASDDVFSHYAQAQIHVIASLSEGCPTVVLEAMSMGLPSVGYADCPGTNELIQHERNGLLVSPEDRVIDLRNALARLMSSSELRARLGEQALRDSHNFSPKTVYDKWERMFYEAAAYKNNPEKLFHEQAEVSSEHALHARRMRKRLYEQLLLSS